MQNLDCFTEQSFVVGFLVENGEESITFPAVEESVDDHKGAFAFVDVFSVDASFFFVLVRCHCNDVVLDLEHSTQFVNVFDNLIRHLFILISQLTNYPQQ